MPPLRLSIILVASIALTGCRRSDSPRASDSTFIATMVELRKLPPTADSAARAAVLRRRGVTMAALEQTARVLARDPVRAGKVWEAIERPEPDGHAASEGAAAGRRPPPGVK